jgi:hypothetical protein
MAAVFIGSSLPYGKMRNAEVKGKRGRAITRALLAGPEEGSRFPPLEFFIGKRFEEGMGDFLAIAARGAFPARFEWY